MRPELKDAALLVIDLQDKLMAAMASEEAGAVTRNTTILLELARRKDIPVLVTQQYPKGLGSTIPAVEEAIASVGAGVRRFDKTEFSACRNPAFEDVFAEFDRRHWLVCGIEAHVCVYQSVRDLCGRDSTVDVIADAVCSRTARNRDTGLDQCRRAGANITSTETLVFEFLGQAGGDDFKALSKLVR